MQRVQFDVQQGNTFVNTVGTLSTNVVEGSFPSATVTVFLSGTNTLASLFQDNIGTVKANPFTADSTGHAFFYAANGRYDVQLSGTGIATPFTFADILLFDNAASGALSQVESTLPSPVANQDIFAASSALHRWQMSNNGAAFDTVIGAATTDTLTHKTLDTAGAGNTLKINGTTVSAVTGTGAVVLATSPTLTTPTLSSGTNLISPNVTGTVAGGATYTAPTITGPTITGTVAGGPTITAPTLTGPTISGTVAGSATYTGPTITSPAITGTVSGGATYTGITLSSATFASPTITGTVAGGATYTNPTFTAPVLGVATGTSLNLGATGTLSTTAQSGTGAIAMTTSPIFITPTLGVASGTSISLSSTAVAVGVTDTGVTQIKRLRFTQATAYSAADTAIALSAGWGTTATVSAASGVDEALTFTVNSSGTGQGASPTITITFKDGTFTNPPVVVVVRNDATSPVGAPPHTVTSTATTATITFSGTPVAGSSYLYIVQVLGR